MTDQIQAVQNLIKANQAAKPRTAYLDVAQGALTTALSNMQQHVAELGKQAEARRQQVIADQKKLQDLQAQVAQDDAVTKAAQATEQADQAAATQATADATAAAS